MSYCHCEDLPLAFARKRQGLAICLYKSEIASPSARNDAKGRFAKTGETRLNCKAGVTLIELIMAMVILSAIALPMGSMIGAQIEGMMESTDFTAAGNLARREMERLNNIPYASVANGSSVSGSYTVAWTVATVAGGGGAARKDITLTAKRTGAPMDLVTLYGSIANNVTYAP